MRRVQKVLSGVFLGGVLLGGIGTGVALVEYSSLAYAGEKHLGEENLVTRQLDYSMAPGTEEVWLIKAIGMRQRRRRTKVCRKESSVMRLPTMRSW